MSKRPIDYSKSEQDAAWAAAREADRQAAEKVAADQRNAQLEAQFPRQ